MSGGYITMDISSPLGPRSGSAMCMDVFPWSMGRNRNVDSPFQFVSGNDGKICPATNWASSTPGRWILCSYGENTSRASIHDGGYIGGFQPPMEMGPCIYASFSNTGMHGWAVFSANHLSTALCSYVIEELYKSVMVCNDKNKIRVLIFIYYWYFWMEQFWVVIWWSSLFHFWPISFDPWYYIPGMPYEITLLPNRTTRYRVTNTNTGHVFSKNTTLRKAKKQVRLLRGYHKGWPQNIGQRPPRIQYHTRAYTRAHAARPRYQTRSQTRRLGWYHWLYWPRGG